MEGAAELFAGVFGHITEVFVIDAKIRQAAVEAQGLKEEVRQGFNRLFGPFSIGQAVVEAEDVVPSA